MFRILLSILLIMSFAIDSTAQRKPRPKKPAQPAAPAPEKQPEPAPPAPPPAPPEPETVKPPAETLAVEQLQKLNAVIETSAGNIVIEFYWQAAPNHVRQFVWLAQSGYFDGMSVSRIIPKFIIQSGNPASWEEPNPNLKKRFDIPKLKAEYDANVKHDRGALAMARPNGEPDGGTAHFFICALKASSLDGQYTVFGHVVSGLDIVDAIAASPIAEGEKEKPRDRIEVKRVVIKNAEAKEQ